MICRTYSPPSRVKLRASTLRLIPSAHSSGLARVLKERKLPPRWAAFPFEMRDFVFVGKIGSAEIAGRLFLSVDEVSQLPKYEPMTQKEKPPEGGFPSPNVGAPEKVARRL